MNFHFLGGADEVGASSTLIEIDGSHILVDVGIRMGPGQNSPLPDFPAFDKIGMPDAVLLTHAHTDHTGALPVLRDLWLAGVKIYYSPATKAITRVLLEDSANRTNDETQEEGKPPLYTADDVAVALHCMEKEVPWMQPVEICPGVTATWIPAGHILGAGMIYIQGKRERILMTGDVSVAPQLTIPGMVVPELCKKPEVMVMEATYGNKRHEVSRKREEKRFVEDIAKVIASDGKVLIPAFAVGRSQEVILILKYAMERGEIPEFPVYVDGMVRKVNEIYSKFPDELSEPLKRKAERGEDLFYSDVIRPVTSQGKSDRILLGSPCCIIASSGMLIGGKSSFYAKRLAADPKNLIAITGYQAEGTPGRELWNWAEVCRPPDQMWQLNDQEPVSVKCQVKKYSLSAHADSTELMELVEKVQPRKLFLVHGDAEARGEFFKSVRKKFPAIDVQLPENGKSYRGVVRRNGLFKGRRSHCDKILSEVFAFVREMEQKGPFRARELTEIWFGTEATTQIAVKFFQWCLSLDVRYFKRGSDDLFYLRSVYLEAAN